MEEVFKTLHDESGHLGYERTMAAIRMRFYWPGMTAQVGEWVRQCIRFTARKTLPVVAAPLETIKTSAPMELVCMDFLSLEPDRSGANSILVITDHYTRYTQAFATRSQTTHTVAKILWEKFFIHYGLPVKLHSDRGANFESRLIAELTRLLGIKKTHTTPYHPQGDPQPERFNRTLLNMLGTLTQEQKPTGVGTCLLWFMPTTARCTILQDFHHTICCLEGNQDKWWMQHMVSARKTDPMKIIKNMFRS